jgi:hypothetical protein
MGIILMYVEKNTRKSLDIFFFNYYLKHSLFNPFKPLTTQP